MSYVESILYKKVNPGDLYNIDRVIDSNAGGGGQTYLDLAGLDQEHLYEFLEYGISEEKEIGDRLKYTISAYMLGSCEQQDIEFDPRNNRPNYKISDQRNNRHLAWMPENGFPTMPPNARGAGDVDNCENLFIFIIKTSDGNYYASFVEDIIPDAWPIDDRFNMFGAWSRRNPNKGFIDFSENEFEFNNNIVNPFILVDEDDTDEGYYDSEAEDDTDEGYYDSEDEDDIDEGYYDSEDEDDIDEGYYDSEDEDDTDEGYYDSEDEDDTDEEYYDSEDEDDTDEGYYDSEDEDEYNMDAELMLVNIPTKMKLPKKSKHKKRRGKKINYKKKNARDIDLGDFGEKLVVKYEKKMLRELGRSDLADKVEWVKETQGDGLGYDVKSFEILDDDKVVEKFIEVKTTTGGINTPFDISAPEVEFSDEYSEQFYLFRVFDAKNNPKLYFIKGSIEENFNLEVTHYKAFKK